MKRIQYSNGNTKSSHKVRQVNRVATFGSIVISEDFVVDKVDAKRVRYHHNDAFGRRSRSWLRRVGGQGVQGFRSASRRAIVDMAGEAVRAGHGWLGCVSTEEEIASREYFRR